jgi:hypothetical protein
MTARIRCRLCRQTIPAWDATEEDYDAYDQRNEDSSPDEQHVVGLAGLWNIDPTTLDREESQGFGMVGELPDAG